MAPAVSINVSISHFTLVPVNHQQPHLLHGCCMALEQLTIAIHSVTVTDTI
jgi:hypothetical protein